jgi:hypothetical protein
MQESIRCYEPPRHNAADAARKGEHRKMPINPLSPLYLCGSIMFCIFARTSNGFLVKEAMDEATSRIFFKNGEKTQVQGKPCFIYFT